ncbi:MAG: hypothetical protein QXT81_06140 [Candidatus Bathyarchaeia archaeon]
MKETCLRECSRRREETPPKQIRNSLKKKYPKLQLVWVRKRLAMSAAVHAEPIVRIRGTPLKRDFYARLPCWIIGFLVEFSPVE